MCSALGQSTIGRCSPGPRRVIHHGGAGTTHAAVAAGVPSVVIPHVGDQPYWAARLHRLGVAPSPLDLKAVTSDAVRERVVRGHHGADSGGSADASAGRVAAEDGLQAAIGLIEGAMRTPAA